MKKFLKYACAFVFLAPCAFFMSACGGPPPHQCNPAEAWSNNSTHHWHDCLSADCNEKSGYAQHNFGSRTADPANPDQHKKTCSDCGYFAYENHTFANGIEDCTCGAHVPVTVITPTMTSVNWYTTNSPLLTAELGKKFVFQITTNNEMWAYRSLKVGPYDTNNTSECDYSIDPSKYTLRLFDENKQEIDLDQYVVNGTDILGLPTAGFQDCIPPQTTFYVMLEFTSLDGWDNNNNPNHNVCIEFADFDHVREFKYAYNTTDYTAYKFVATNVPTGTVISFAPEKSGVVVAGSKFQVRKLNTTDGTFTTLSAPQYVFTENVGASVTVEEDGIYYFEIKERNCAGGNVYRLKNTAIGTANPINTCQAIKEYSSVISGTANQTYLFDYKANSFQPSKILFNVVNEANTALPTSDYQLRVIQRTGEAFYDRTEDLQQNANGQWLYDTTGLVRDTKFIIEVTSLQTQNFKVEVEQIDQIKIVRELNGGTLPAGQGVNILIDYGTAYSPASPLELGVPTNGIYEFTGWTIQKLDNTFVYIATQNGNFTATWISNASTDFRRTGSVKIYANYTIRRTVTLDKNGGEWNFSPGAPTKSLEIRPGETISEQYKASKSGFVFMGYYDKQEKGKCLISANGTVLDLSSLTSAVENEYTLYAYWATTLPTCAEEISVPASTKGYYVFTTGDWNLPSGTTTAQARVELAGVSIESYLMSIVDASGVAAQHNQSVYDLKPQTQYFVTLAGNGGSAITEKTLVITRDFVANPTTTPTSYEIRTIDFVAGEKVIIKINPAYTGSYIFTTTQNEYDGQLSQSSLTSIKLLDANMALVRELTETSTNSGRYALGSLVANSVHYIEIVFSANRTNVNFILQ